MVTLDDVVQRLIQQLQVPEGIAPRAALKEFLQSRRKELHICITPDVEATELTFLQHYGRGHTFYFKLRNHGHGQQLIEALRKLLDMTNDAEAEFENMDTMGKQLYLFIMIRRNNVHALKRPVMDTIAYAPWIGYGRCSRL